MDDRGSSLPNRVLHVLTIKSNEEAQYCEEHDSIGSHYQATGSSLNHSGGGSCSVPHGHHIIKTSRWWCGGGGVRDRWLHCDRSPGEHYWESKGRYDDACGEEPGQLSAGVAGGVFAVSLGYEGGNGGEEIEDDHCERVPIVELWESTSKEEKKEPTPPPVVEEAPPEEDEGDAKKKKKKKEPTPPPVVEEAPPEE